MKTSKKERFISGFFNPDKNGNAKDTITQIQQMKDSLNII